MWHTVQLFTADEAIVLLRLPPAGLPSLSIFQGQYLLGIRGFASEGKEVDSRQSDHRERAPAVMFFQSDRHNRFSVEFKKNAKLRPMATVRYCDYRGTSIGFDTEGGIDIVFTSYSQQDRLLALANCAEARRTVSMNGIVTRYLRTGQKEVLKPNGVRVLYSSQQSSELNAWDICILRPNGIDSRRHTNTKLWEHVSAPGCLAQMDIGMR